MVVLKVCNLKKYFMVDMGPFKPAKINHAVDDVSFTVEAGEILGLVGESGSGKTTCGKTVMRLYEPDGGRIVFKGNDITALKGPDIRKYYRQMGFVHQDPFGSLDPRTTAGEIISEPLEVHRLYSKKEQREKVLEIVEKVGLMPEQMDRYPHEFSGGQRQRIAIARALVVNPDFIVADEIVSALDVSIQAQIINLIQDLQEKFRFAALFISHDMSVIKHICDRVAVMHVGKIIEVAEKDKLFNNPKHPYTEALLSAVPIQDPRVKPKEIILTGDPPSTTEPPPGCRFHTRCPIAAGICSKKEPPLEDKGDKHFTACHFR